MGFLGSGVNLYAYSGNNPVVGTDPSGLAGDYNDVGPLGGGGGGDYSSEEGPGLFSKLFGEIKGFFGGSSSEPAASSSEPTGGDLIHQALDPSVHSGVVCSEGLFIVEQHLHGFPSAYGEESLNPEIQAQLDRIVAAYGSGASISGAD